MGQCNPLKAIFILTYVSLFIAAIIFILAMFDLGIASLWMNVALPLVTTAYHITILILHRRTRRTAGRGCSEEQQQEQHPQDRVYPTSAIASLVCAYILAFFWLLPFGIMVGHLVVTSDEDDAFVGNVGTVITQIVLDIVEVGILAAVAGISTRMRRRTRKWVRIDEVRLSESTAIKSQASYDQANGTVDKDTLKTIR